MIGQTISHYKILEKLGEGGMGIVYKAHDTELDRDVALKFLPNYLTSDEAERERFYHEARAASALNHSNITTIYEIGQAGDPAGTTAGGQLFIAMEYVEGKTLKKLIEQDTFTITKVLEIAIQTCDGLAAAAEKGVVHRDIKSDNIMVTPKGQVKITDFGLAKIKGASRLTKAGSTLGTAAYMSPEQAQGAEADHRSDIFSFGVVLYELFTGRLPFRGEHHSALMYSLINEDPPPVARFNDKVTPELERILSKALAKDKEDRYQHIDELAADLRRERKQIEYARTGYVKTSSIAAPVDAVPMKKRLWRYLIPVAVVLAAVVLVLIFNPFNFQVNMQKSTASEKNSLAVLYFENIPDPEDKDHTGEMLTSLLITSLSQAKGLEVISRERLMDIQKELGQGDAKTISISLASQVAKKAGVTVMLVGKIFQKEPKLVVTTQLNDVQSGKVLSSQRLTDFSADQIFALVDTLALHIRSDLNITPSSQAEAKSVAEVTTKSPEAYRSYIEGLDLFNKLFFREAQAAFARSTELDKEFAMAYFYLSNTQAVSGDAVALRTSLQKAVKLSDRVTERERLQIYAASFSQQNNPQKAVETLEKLIEQFPHEKAYVQLAFVYAGLLELEKSTEVFRRGLRIDPYDKVLWNGLAYSLAGLNRRDEALEAINEYLKLAPGEPNPYDSKGDIHAKFDEYDSSRVWYQKANGFRHDYSADKLGCDAVLRLDYVKADQFFKMVGFEFPLIELHRGLLKHAQNKLAEFPSAHFPQGPGFAGLRQHVQVAYEAGDYPKMLRLAKELSVESKKNLQDRIYGRDYLAWALLKNGNSIQAHKTLNEIQADLDPKLPGMQVAFDYASALVAFEEGKYNDVVVQFRKVYSKFFPNHDPNLFFAVGLLKKGEMGEASSQLERLTRWYPTIGGAPTLIGNPGSTLYWPISAVKAHYWLGVAYEQQGDKQKAIKEYETFLDIWKDADTLTKEIQEAKARLAQLKGTNG